MRIFGKDRVINTLKENLITIQCVEVITPDGIWECKGIGRFYRLTEMYIKSEEAFKHRYYSEVPYPFCTFCGVGLDETHKCKCEVETLDIDELINRVTAIDEDKSYVCCAVVNN